MSSFDVRPFLPIDLPLVHRLAPHSVSLDTELALTHGVQHSLGTAFLNSLADLGTSAFVLRDNDTNYLSQFRHRVGDQHAHIAFIAPGPTRTLDSGAWLALIDAMVSAAGKRGAHTLNAEIDETADAFVILRQCGFAVYARQEIWRRAPAAIPAASGDHLRLAIEADAFAINALYNNIVPRIMLQADAPPEPGRGLVVEQERSIVAFVSVSEGKNGIYIQPFIHPEMFDQAQDIHRAVLSRLPRAERIPAYICVRRYQDWLRGPLSRLGFEPWNSQAVMVKHTVARIEHRALKTIPAIRGARVVPPIKNVVPTHHSWPA